MRRGFSFLNEPTTAALTIRAFQIAFFSFLFAAVVKMSSPRS